MKTDALRALKHSGRAVISIRGKTLEEFQLSEPGLKRHQGWRHEGTPWTAKKQNKILSRCSPGEPCLPWSSSRSWTALPKATLAEVSTVPWLADTWHKKLQPKPVKFGKILAKLNHEFNNRKHHVISVIADTTHSAYNTAISQDKLPASNCPHRDSLRCPEESTAFLCAGEKCDIYHMPFFFFAFPFPLTSDWQVQIKISHPASSWEHEILIWGI